MYTVFGVVYKLQTKNAPKQQQRQTTATTKRSIHIFIHCLWAYIVSSSVCSVRKTPPKISGKYFDTQKSRTCVCLCSNEWRESVSDTVLCMKSKRILLVGIMCWAQTHLHTHTQCVGCVCDTYCNAWRNLENPCVNISSIHNYTIKSEIYTSDYKFSTYKMPFRAGAML